MPLKNHYDQLMSLQFKLRTAFKSVCEHMGMGEDSKFLNCSIIPGFEHGQFATEYPPGDVFTLYDDQQAERKLVKLRGYCYFYGPASAPPGLTQHPTISGLHFCPNPMTGYGFHIDNILASQLKDTSTTNINEQLTQLGVPHCQSEALTEDQHQDNALTLGKKYLADALAYMKKSHPHQPTTIIVLGNKSVGENIEIYAERHPIQIADEQHHIDQYQLPSRTLTINCEELSDEYHADISSDDEPGEKTESTASTEATEAIATLLYINASENKLSLTLADISSLYHIAQQLKKAEITLLIHCQQGLDRASKLGLALDLFIHFEQYFPLRDNGQQTMKTEEFANALLQVIEDFRRARSPEALTKKDDIEQAIYLAFSLRAFELVQRAEQAFIEYVTTTLREENNRLSEGDRSLLALAELFKPENHTAASIPLPKKLGMVNELLATKSVKVSGPLRITKPAHKLSTDSRSQLTELQRAYQLLESSFGALDKKLCPEPAASCTSSTARFAR